MTKVVELLRRMFAAIIFTTDRILGEHGDDIADYLRTFVAVILYGVAFGIGFRLVGCIW